MSIRIDGTNTTANPGITGGDADTGLQFGTDEIQFVTGGTNRATVESNGNFTIESGNLILASGGGIDFSADSNAAGMTSELLDDYEEGTFTPSYSAAGCTFSYNLRYGFYTKIGRQVFFSLWIRGQSSGSTGSPLGIVDLPFTSSNAAGNYSAVYMGQIYFIDYPTTDNPLNMFITPGTSKISMEYAQDNTTTLSLPATAVDGTTDAGFILSGHYFV